MALVGAIAALQTALTLGGGRATHHFEPDGSDISPFAARLSRAYANCNENLPAFAAILLTALATEQSEITDGLALWVFAARIAQSTIHLVSTNAPAVTARFGFFLVQWGIQAWWVAQLISELIA